jgi:hypothetical protein
MTLTNNCLYNIKHSKCSNIQPESLALALGLFNDTFSVETCNIESDGCISDSKEVYQQQADAVKLAQPTTNVS